MPVTYQLYKICKIIKVFDQVKSLSLFAWLHGESGYNGKRGRGGSKIWHLAITATNISFRKLSLNWKEHSKTRKEHVLIKHVFLIRLLQINYMVELGYIKGFQKQPFADVLQNSCPWTFCKFHRKAPVFESLFNRVAGLKRLHHKFFLWFLQNF